MVTHQPREDWLIRHHTEYGQSGQRVQKKKPRRSGAVGADTGTIVITGAEGRSYSWKSAVRSGIHTNMSE